MTKRYEASDVTELRRWLDDMRKLAAREGVYNGNRAVLDIIARVEPLLAALTEDADKWQRAALTLQGDRDALRAGAERLTEQIEAAKRIGLGTHLGRLWVDVINDMLRALDGNDT